MGSHVLLNAGTSKNHIKKNARAVLKKLWQFGKRSSFLRYHNGSINISVNTSEIFFSNNVVKTLSYGLKVSRNIDVKDPFYFKAYFHVHDVVRAICLGAFNLIEIFDIMISFMLKFASCYPSYLLYQEGLLLTLKIF